MVDTCTVRTGGALGALNPATLQHASVAGDLIYAGKCRVKPAAGNQDRVVDAGEHLVSLWPFTVSLPMSAVGVDVDHIVTVTTSALDAALAGKTLRVRQVALGTHLTARRLGCEINVG